MTSARESRREERSAHRKTTVSVDVCHSDKRIHDGRPLCSAWSFWVSFWPDGILRMDSMIVSSKLIANQCYYFTTSNGGKRARGAAENLLNDARSLGRALGERKTVPGKMVQQQK